jgi:hypothetical protein
MSSTQQITQHNTKKKIVNAKLRLHNKLEKQNTKYKFKVQSLKKINSSQLRFQHITYFEYENLKRINSTSLFVNFSSYRKVMNHLCKFFEKQALKRVFYKVYNSELNQNFSYVKIDFISEFDKQYFFRRLSCHYVSYVSYVSF